MNIFKILSSGHGSIKEPSVSAFLGYLLNPNADHGLNSVFLEKFLSNFLEMENSPLNPIFSHIEKNDEEEMYILDMSYLSRFNVEVFLEKGLKGENTKQEIVDIIVKITEKPKIKMHDISNLFNDEIPVALILIETKIKDSGPKTFIQIKQQYDILLNLLPKYTSQTKGDLWKNKICSVLVSTNNEKELNKFREEANSNSIHLYWDDLNKNSIKSILIEILTHNQKGQISPIPSYTCETLKALINFIENDFSSNTDDQQKEPKKTTRNIYSSYNIFKQEQINKFSETQWLILDTVHAQLQKYSEIYFRYSPTHPISLFENKDLTNKFFSFGSNLQLHLPLRKKIFKNNEISSSDIRELKKFLELEGVTKIHISKSDNVMVATKDDLSSENVLNVIDFFRNFLKQKSFKK